MTNLYPQNSKFAWVGLSRPAAGILTPDISVLESENRFEITVPLWGTEPGEVGIELAGGMIVISTKGGGAPSEDLDDVFAPERTAPLTRYVMVDDLDPHSISALHVGDTVVISARKRRAG